MLEGVIKGEYQLVFFTPEILLNAKNWRQLVQTESYTRRVKTLVIDEAHTVKKWYANLILTMRVHKFILSLYT